MKRNVAIAVIIIILFILISMIGYAIYALNERFTMLARNRDDLVDIEDQV
jgi:hypothetical protein